jgi:hypothetical protein
MMIRRLVMLTAAVEVLAGSVLIASPTLFVQLLLRSNLTDGGIAVGRVGGFGLLSLGLACWPRGDVVTAQSTSALFTYNLLAALYIVDLGVTRDVVGYLLWPACVLHALFALLLARPAYEAIRRQSPGVPVQKTTT